MQVRSAIALINQIVYRPGWHISATDHSDRFEGTVIVRVDYPAENTNRDQAAHDYPERIATHATFPIIVADCADETTLYRRVLRDVLLLVDEHEAREYFRISPTYWAPFHPHRVDGMERWGNPRSDLHFGIA